MFGLQGDFESYLTELKKARRRTVVFLALAVIVTLFFSITSIALLLGGTLAAPFAAPSQIMQYANVETSVNLAHFFFNIAVASLIRYWYLRQDKLTTLLTQAMVIEREHETAIRILLKQRRSR